MNKTFTSEKSTCEKYTLRWNHSGWWAIFFVDSERGALSVQSGYGDYSYMWGNHGRESFKHFILELDKDHQYIMGKFSMGNKNGDWFDYPASVKRLKEQITEARREKYVTPNVARRAWNSIGSLDDFGGNSADLFAMGIYENPDLMACVGEEMECMPVVKDYNPDLKNFMKNIFPAFVGAIREEISS